MHGMCAASGPSAALGFRELQIADDFKRESWSRVGCTNLDWSGRRVLSRTDGLHGFAIRPSVESELRAWSPLVRLEFCHGAATYLASGCG